MSKGIINYPSQNNKSFKKKTEQETLDLLNNELLPWFRAGKSLLPLVDKRPVAKWKPFQTTQPHVTDLAEWANIEDVSWALITGSMAGVVVVDFDNEDALAWGLEHGQERPAMRVKTGKGEHWYYRYPAGQLVGNRVGVEGRGYDIRGEGGYVVIPPSIHKSGRAYAWEEEFPLTREGINSMIESLPVFDPAAWGCKVVDAATAEEARRQIDRRRTELESNPAEKIRMAKEWLSYREGAVEGDYGDTHTYVTAAILVNDFALDVLDAVDLLDGEWNLRCSPPWAREELEVKVESASNSNYKARGSRLVKNRVHDWGDRALREYLEDEMQDYIYVANRKVWYEWVGTHWRPVVKEAVETVVEGRLYDFADEIREVAKTVEDKQQKSLLRRAESLESVRAKGVWTLGLQSALIGDTADFEGGTEAEHASDSLLNFRNGTLDLQTRELREHRKADHLVSVIDQAYTPGATHPLWEEFLDHMSAGDDEFKQYLKRCFGYTLAGFGNKIFILQCSEGRSGKSVLIDLIRMVLGEMATVLPEDFFQQKKLDPRVMASTPGKRYAIIDDLEASSYLNEASAKKVTGQAGVVAERKWENSFATVPKFCTYVTTNEMPRFKASNSIDDRMVILPLKARSLKDGEKDEGLKWKLCKEAGSAVLAWLTEGLFEYMDARGSANPFAAPVSVRVAKKELNEDNDLGKQFVEDCLTEDAHGFMRSSHMLLLFNEWQREEHGGGKAEITAHRLVPMLKSKGLVIKRTKHSRGFEGVGLTEAGLALLAQASDRRGMKSGEIYTRLNRREDAVEATFEESPAMN